VRAGDPQPRPLHLLRDPLLEARGRSRLTDTLVIGLGNSWRGDDGAGPAVARGLLDEVQARVRVREGEPVGLIEDWTGADAVIVVDAVSSGAPPGTIHRLDPISEPIPAALSQGSTHAFGLADTIELARTLARLPPSLTVYGIEGEDFRAGDELSVPVRAAVEAVRLELRERLGKAAGDVGQDPDAKAPERT
jgi:hydrogenase maturation protease